MINKEAQMRESNLASDKVKSKRPTALLDGHEEISSIPMKPED